jgi:hypothetical protein
MSWRKIVIDGDVYRWKCGHSNVSIRNEKTGKGVNIAITELKPISSEEVESMHWHDNPYGGVTPEDVRLYINGNLRREELGIDAIKILQDIYYEKRSAAYAGGTLTVQEEDKFLMFNVGKGSSDEENCWIALNYVKNKNSNCSFWDEAIRILRLTPGFKKIATKAMLRSF